jgi:hypothetical protein
MYDDSNGRDSRGRLPRWSAGDFEDEPPGAYLEELRAGRGTWMWSAANLLLTAAMGVVWFASDLSPESPWWLPGKLLWSLLPISSLIAVIVAGWQLLLGGRASARQAALAGIALGVLAGGLWLALRYGAAVHFAAA